MEDTATKIKTLTANLQEAQSKVTKKKEEIENKNKQLKEISEKNNELGYVLEMKRREFIVKSESMISEKEQKKKAIEELKAIIASDKDTLLKQKEELLAKLQKTEKEASTLEADKKALLESKKDEIPDKIKKEESKTEEEVPATFEALTKDFKIGLNEKGIIDVKSLVKIIDVCTTMAGSKIKEQIVEYRKKLRKNAGSDLTAYLEGSSKEINQHTQIYNDIEKEVLTKLNIDKKLLDGSIQVYMDEGNYEIYSLMSMLGDKLKSFIVATKKVDKDTYKKILEFKLDYVRKEADEVFKDDNRRLVAQKSFAHHKGTYEEKEEPSIMVLKNYFEFKLGMEISSKFGVEEEDVREAMMTPDVQFDVDITQLTIQLSEEFSAKIPKAKLQLQKESKGQPEERKV